MPYPIFSTNPLFPGDLIHQGLEDTILYQPADVEGLCCQTLRIVTGYTDCERISTHLIQLKDGIEIGKYRRPLSVHVILGMTDGSGLTVRKHQNIKRTVQMLNTTRGMPFIECRYICNRPFVHTKLYEWENSEGTPRVAFCGSVNYSMAAFRARRECMTQCSPASAWYYYNLLLPDTIDCLDPDVMERIRFTRRQTGIEVENDPDNEDYEYYDQMEPIDTLHISLLGARGGLGYGSSVNWGIRPNGTPRNPNQAYIPYNRADRKEGFFPDRVNPDDRNCPVFRVITRSRGTFHMRMAQQNNKALQSAESNAILGEWIRHEMNLPAGSFITAQMLENYGKTYVTFRKYEDGTYLLDF